MSTRLFKLAAAAAVLGFASGTTISGKNLRMSEEEMETYAKEMQQKRAYEQKMQDAQEKASAAKPVEDCDDCDDGDDDDFTKGSFTSEQGMKCEGGFDEKRFGRKCEGGVKMEFEAETDAADVIEKLIGEFYPQMEATWIPSKESMLSAFEPQQLMAEKWEDGMEQTVEVGGLAKVEWGCKVTFKMEDGKFSQKAECGGKGMEGIGVKPE
mmetsp:Transcript_15981/g.44208  ORF Transcript_15981/g.44208 Transcript_15981/m.44208 type:complete len:210 (-) Transcript_15981:257-886(-)